MAKGVNAKLNRLQQLPDTALVDAAWLENHGYSSSLRSQYVKAGWLGKLAPRVYRRGNGPLYWQQVVTSLQTFLDLPLTVGGRTALEEQGYAHYLGQRQEVHLYGQCKAPSWLNALPLDIKFHWHNSRRLFPDSTDVAPRKQPVGAERAHMMPGGFMLSGGGMVSWPLRYSSPERAFLELIDELPNHESFHQVDMLMEGLVNLSPRNLQVVLETCGSIKVKRLFFYFADRHHHAWLQRLDKSKIDLGAGKRVLVKGGKLDPHYLITVPEDMHGLS